ncbi:MAG TPA: hypothetical protein DDZ81_01650 [Acetobacteraceae bacterium]|jgi:hypothetical protein|nr:hypothetical protein [Acetobacteraceae bacterium]
MPPQDDAPKPPAKPVRSPDALAREAAALRANLLKRKDQMRKREETKEKPDTANQTAAIGGSTYTNPR